MFGRSFSEVSASDSNVRGLAVGALKAKAKLDEVMEKLDYLMLSCFSPEKKPGVDG